MSDKDVELLYGEEVFTIDFVRTTKFVPNVSTPYKMKFDPNPEISVFDRNRLESGPYKALAKVDALEQTVQEIRKYVDNFILFMIAVLGIIVGVIGVIAAAPSGVARTLSLPGVALAIAIVALLIAAASLRLSRRRLAAYGDTSRPADQ